MVKNHLIRINAPRTWQIKRKEDKFITRPNPGQSSMEMGMPLSLVLKDMLGLAKTSRDIKYLLNNQEVLVDHRRRKEPKFITGFMDVISIPSIKKDYRMIINDKGRIGLIEISKEEANIKLCKIIGKSPIKGKLQLNLSDGKNILTDKNDYKIGDIIVYDLINNKVKDVIKLEKNSSIFLIGGKYIGESGKVVDIGTKTITYKNQKGDTIETLKKYAYCIGKDKEIIKIR